EIIYLHQVRGFSTSTAGLVLAATMATSAVIAPLTGALVDRYSAKAFVIAGNLASALGYAGFAFVERPWQGFACSIVSGVVLVVVGHTFFSNILPPFAKAHTPVGPAEIGIVILVNTAFIVIAQIPAVGVMARLRRTHAFAVASALFAVALLAVLPATLIHSELAATSVFAGVAIVLAIGEIAHILVLGPLVADMAPEHLLGRYLSPYTLTFPGFPAL